MAAALCCPFLAGAQAPTVDGCTVFSANNVWNTRIDALPVAPNSDALVQAIGSSAGVQPEFGSSLTGPGFPINVVPGSQPRVPVYGLPDSGFNGYPVPIPANPSFATDTNRNRYLLILDTTNCLEYELYGAYQPYAGGVWLANAGDIFPLASSELPPLEQAGADISGLPILPGLVRYDEVASGSIQHALRFTAPTTNWTFIWPARDPAAPFFSTIQYPPLGQRFRLKKSFDVSSYPAHVQVILNALKTYGMFLADTGVAWSITGVPDTRWNDDELQTLTQVAGSNFEAVDESSLMADMNSGQVATGAVPPPGFSPNTWLNLVSVNSGKCLSVTGGPSATASDVAMSQATCTGDTSQSFNFTAASYGRYLITAQNSGMQLFAGGENAGAGILQTPNDESWGLTAHPDNVYTFSPAVGLCMDVSGASFAEGKPVILWPCSGHKNQEWVVVPVVTPNVWLRVISKNSGKCLSVTGGPSATDPGDTLSQAACTGDRSQAFQFMRVTGGGYKIIAASSNLELGIAGNSSSLGVGITQEPDSGAADQIWKVAGTVSGSYTIFPTSTGMCMDVSGASFGEGKPVIQWPCSGHENRQWTFAAAQ